MAAIEHLGEEDLARAISLVAQTIRELGVDPDTARTDSPDGSARFVLRRGSVRVAVQVLPPREGASHGSLRVVAPIVDLPAESSQLPFLRRLLEVNARELAGAAFGIVADAVVLVSERSLEDLDASEVQTIVHVVDVAADTWDDALADEFDVIRASDHA